MLLPPRGQLRRAHDVRQDERPHEKPLLEPSADWKNRLESGKGGSGSAWSGRYAPEDGLQQGRKWFSSKGWTDDVKMERRDEAERPRGLRIELGSSQLGDEGVLQWIKMEGPEVLRCLGAGGFDSVDLSENQLTDAGVKMLVKWLLLECRMPVRRLKLFKNNLRSPVALCGLIEDSILGVSASAGLRELHLSSNEIDKEGVIAVLESICRGRRKVSAAFDPPLWLRLERCEHHLSEERAQVVVEDFAARGLQICLEGGVAGCACSIAFCRHGADVHLHVVGGNKSTAAGRRSW